MKKPLAVVATGVTNVTGVATTEGKSIKLQTSGDAMIEGKNSKLQTTAKKQHLDQKEKSEFNSLVVKNAKGIRRVIVRKNKIVKESVDKEVKKYKVSHYSMLQVGCFSTTRSVNKLKHKLEKAGFEVITKPLKRRHHADLIKVMVLVKHGQSVKQTEKLLSKKYHLHAILIK